MIILYDLSAAFDTVSHDILLEKLKAYGFDDSALKWILSHKNKYTMDTWPLVIFPSMEIPVIVVTLKEVVLIRHIKKIHSAHGGTSSVKVRTLLQDSFT